MSTRTIDATPKSKRRDPGAAEPIRFVLLSLLLDGSSYGYDLARHFGPGTALGEVVHLSASHLYALLVRLEADDLITGEQQDAGARPQRRVYRLTEAGNDALQAWIDMTVEHPRDMRIEFPLKLYSARRLDSEKASDLVSRQAAVFHAYINRLQHEDVPTAVTADAEFITLMREARIGRARAALDWLSQCETVLHT